MLRLNIFLLVLMIVSIDLVNGQSIKRMQMLGEYESTKVNGDFESTDTLWKQDKIPIIPIKLIEIDPFMSKTLILKWPNRFKILDFSPIPDIGFNLDNPTVYGKFKLKDDSLILRTKYSIQHFNKLAPKSRVKIKNRIRFAYKVLNNRHIQINSTFVLKKKEGFN